MSNGRKQKILSKEKIDEKRRKTKKKREEEKRTREMTYSYALTKVRINLTNAIYMVQQSSLFEEQELLGCNDVVSGMAIEVSDERIPKYISTRNTKAISSSKVRRTFTGIHGYRTQKNVVA
jgi:hypothetical protein